MNTGIRRFILCVAVGLLAYLLGVAVAWALGGINPFQGSSGSYRKRCGQHRSWSSSSSSGGSYYVTTTETVNHYEGGRSCRTKRMFVADPPPPPPPTVALDE